jgi:hypothetical protein
VERVEAEAIYEQHVATDRHEDHAKSLLADTTAVVTSDRWWAYPHLPRARCQLCWAHWARDFKAHAEGLAAEKEFGKHGPRIDGVRERAIRAVPDVRFTVEFCAPRARGGSLPSPSRA